VPVDLEGILSKALSMRNFLAHQYFRERAELFMNERGREDMIAELQDAQKLFELADERLFEVVRPIRERYGLTDDVLKSYESEYLKRYESEL